MRLALGTWAVAVALILQIGAPVAAQASSVGLDAEQHVPIYVYDASRAFTTLATNLLAHATSGEPASSSWSRPATSSTVSFRAAKASRIPQVGEGIVYRRTSRMGGQPYIGQSKSAARYDARQLEHPPVRYACGHISRNPDGTGDTPGGGCALHDNTYAVCHPNATTNQYYALGDFINYAATINTRRSVYVRGQTGGGCFNAAAAAAPQQGAPPVGLASSSPASSSDTNALSGVVANTNALQPQLGASAAWARRFGGNIFVVPSTLGRCMASIDPAYTALACGPLQRVSMATLGPDSRTVWGMAEDGINSVHVSLADSTVQEVPVVRNSFRAVLPAAAMDISP